MSVAVVLLAIFGSIVAFLYFKKLICVEESALRPKTNPAEPRTRESRLPCTAKEPTKLKTTLEETANIEHVPDIPERIEGGTAVVAIGSMVHLPDLQGGFAAMSAKFNMMATPQWSILCESENSADKAWLSNEVRYR
uniref:Uncharacterized protein n=1 Tax=Ascaris lumbricoides TaxID=6252 RepID=A0A9J2PP12_ASCLU